MTKSRGILPPKVFWTDAEREIVRQLYPDTKNSEIVKVLGRHTEKSIWGIAKKLGVKKSPEYLRVMGGYLDGKRGSQKRFEPGHVPWIKGKKLPGRTSSTSFVKGQRPPNWKPMGSHRVNGEGYLERKVREGNNGGLNWEAVHRLVWKAANGAIPRNHVVVFKEARFTNVLEQITLDAIELVSRKQLMSKNTIWVKNPELAALYQLKGQITRQVNRIKETQHVQPSY
ncbi:MAG: HNH endonuclease [Rhodoferax sp.]|uniref:HNH endonuclease n=1 Tax=Rhodoferax sp. TaxID=50421 RepID=UPI00272EEB11|nr:HNH endonuclease [Rhodoferax sp.]MDP1530284.1 HNH endonuclease [Rhodoferax sp.]MDP1943369.1 HNH endonuclease [Rhodoferax sp.]